MKVRSLSRFFMGMLAMCAIAACSNDELDVNGTNPDPDASNGAVYMNVTVQLPTGAGTRSQTGSTTTEEGKDYENEVKNVLLVLAEYDVKEDGTSGPNDNKFIGYTVNKKDDLDVEASFVKSVQAISKTVLATYYSNYGELVSGSNSDYKLKPNKDIIRVYAFCNPTTTMVDYFKGDKPKDNWFNECASITETTSTAANRAEETQGETEDGNAIWGGSNNQGGFLMSTASRTETKKQIPKRLSVWNNYTSVGTAFNFSGINNAANSDDEIKNEGVISVERVVARLDFKDGSDNSNTYNVVTQKVNNETKVLVQIQLTKMALVNMSKKFYYLRRVSTDGLGTNVEICGNETAKNYVVDYDATEKSGDLANFNYGEHFNFCLGQGTGNNWAFNDAARNGWDVIDINTVTGNENTENTASPKYHIWRYVTENTIPAAIGGKELQRNGISTGIVFKGKLIVTDEGKNTSLKQISDEADIPLQGIAKDDPILYEYSGDLYVRWTEVREKALEEGSDPFFKKAVIGTPSEGIIPVAEVKGENDAVYSDDVTSPDYWWARWQKNIPPAEDEEEGADPEKNFKEAVTKARFTLYQSSKENNVPGYYCYYFYWNRHNDNLNGGIMGPMEFATVRNNVYKLSVTNIRRLGHPRIPENDPDPIDPKDPDEKEDVYLSVSVQVLPWVVRENNIEF